MEKVMRFSSPEAKEKEENAFYRSLTSAERVRIVEQLRQAWIPEDEQGLERVYRIVTVPKR